MTTTFWPPVPDEIYDWYQLGCYTKQVIIYPGGLNTVFDAMATDPLTP